MIVGERRTSGVRQVRWIVLAVAALVAACSGGAGDVALTRSAVPAADVVTTTTGGSRSTTSVEELATTDTTAGHEHAGLGVEDPILPSEPRSRSRAGRARPAAPEPTGHLEIPAIGLSHPTYEGIDLATIDHGPSHWPGTALPGEPGNTVFPGHRTTYSRPFWDIAELVPGDDVIFTTPAGRFAYRVTDTFVVNERDTWIVDPTEHATFTIFACHPKGSARQRYVAKGDLVSPPATTTTTTPATTTTTTTTPPEDERTSIVPGLPS